MLRKYKTCPAPSGINIALTIDILNMEDNFQALAVLENGDNTTEDELCSMSRGNILNRYIYVE